MGDEYQYSAFISYRHLPEDRKWARRIQSRLEGYRLEEEPPKELARGRLRLKRVFRDDDELPATANLPAKLTLALEKSHSLIVVCSEKTPASRWVRSEIEEFQRLGRSDRIFCILIGGSVETAIPAPLDPDQILAIDIGSEAISKGGRSIDRVVAKLVAGIVGLEFDEVWKRDQRERRRRWTRWIAAATAGVLIALGLSGAWVFQYRETLRSERSGVAARALAASDSGSGAKALQELANVRGLVPEWMAWLVPEEPSLQLAAFATLLKPVELALLPQVSSGETANEAFFTRSGSGVILRRGGGLVLLDLDDGKVRSAREMPDLGAARRDTVSQLTTDPETGDLIIMTRHGPLPNEAHGGVSSHEWGDARCLNCSNASARHLLFAERDPEDPDRGKVVMLEPSTGEQTILSPGIDPTLGIVAESGEIVVLAGRDGVEIFETSGSLRPRFALDIDTPISDLALARNSFDQLVLVAADERSHSGWIWIPETNSAAQDLEFAWNATAVTFSPDGSLFGVVYGSGKASLWDAHQAVEYCPLSEHDGSISFLDFSPIEDRVITAGSDRQAIVWSTRTCKPLAHLPHEFPVEQAEFSPRGDVILTTEHDGAARLWAAQNRVDPVQMSDFTPIWYAQNVVRSDFIIDGDGRVRRLGGRPSAFVDAWQNRDSARPTDMSDNYFQVLAEGRGFVIQRRDDHRIMLWHEDGSRHEIFPDRWRDVAAISVAPDDSTLVGVDGMGTAHVWNTAERHYSGEVATGCPDLFVVVGPRGRWVACLGENQEVRVVDLETGQGGVLATDQPVWNDAHDSRRRGQAPAGARKGRPHILGFGPSGDSIVVLGGESISILPLDGSAKQTLTVSLIFAELSRDGERLLVSHGSGADVWQLRSLERTPIATDRVAHAAMDPSGTVVAISSGFNFGAPTLFNARTGRIFRTLNPTSAGVNSHLAFSSTGRQLYGFADQPGWRAKRENTFFVSWPIPPIGHAAFDLVANSPVWRPSDTTSLAWKSEKIESPSAARETSAEQLRSQYADFPVLSRHLPRVHEGVGGGRDTRELALPVDATSPYDLWKVTFPAPVAFDDEAITWLSDVNIDVNMLLDDEGDEGWGSTSLSLGFIDLNGDGRREAILQESNNGWCGSRGCTTGIHVYEEQSRGWRGISRNSCGGGGLFVASTGDDGFRDLYCEVGSPVLLRLSWKDGCGYVGDEEQWHLPPGCEP